LHGSLFFNEVKKRSLAANFITVLCGTVIDKTKLLEIGRGVILPLERHTIYVTFAPMANDTTRTALAMDVRRALKSHKQFFFKEGLTLQIASSIPVSPRYIFYAGILTLLFLDQIERVPTPTERPRQGLDLLDKIPP
jgi:hypothetical protein